MASNTGKAEQPVPARAAVDLLELRELLEVAVVGHVAGEEHAPRRLDAAAHLGGYSVPGSAFICSTISRFSSDMRRAPKCESLATKKVMVGGGPCACAERRKDEAATVASRTFGKLFIVFENRTRRADRQEPDVDGTLMPSSVPSRSSIVTTC